MLNVSAEFKKSDIDNLLKNFSGSLVRKAVRSAIDRTATWSKKEIIKNITGHYNISPTKVKSAITTERTKQNTLKTAINIRGVRLPIGDTFPVWQDSVGVKAQISKGEAWSYPHAFLQAVTGGGKMGSFHMSRFKTPAPTGIRPMKVEWANKSKQLKKQMRTIKKKGLSGKIVIMSRIGKERYPTTGKPGRGPSIPMLANRLSYRSQRDSAIINHLYKEMADQISKRTMAGYQTAELE